MIDTFSTGVCQRCEPLSILRPLARRQFGLSPRSWRRRSLRPSSAAIWACGTSSVVVERPARVRLFLHVAFDAIVVAPASASAPPRSSRSRRTAACWCSNGTTSATCTRGVARAASWTTSPRSCCAGRQCPPRTIRDRIGPLAFDYVRGETRCAPPYDGFPGGAIPPSTARSPWSANRPICAALYCAGKPSPPGWRGVGGLIRSPSRARPLTTREVLDGLTRTPNLKAVLIRAVSGRSAARRRVRGALPPTRSRIDVRRPMATPLASMPEARFPTGAGSSAVTSRSITASGGASSLSAAMKRRPAGVRGPQRLGEAGTAAPRRTSASAAALPHARWEGCDLHAGGLDIGCHWGHAPAAASARGVRISAADWPERRQRSPHERRRNRPQPGIEDRSRGRRSKPLGHPGPQPWFLPSRRGRRVAGPRRVLHGGVVGLPRIWASFSTGSFSAGVEERDPGRWRLTLMALMARMRNLQSRQRSSQVARRTTTRPSPPIGT